LTTGFFSPKYGFYLIYFPSRSDIYKRYMPQPIFSQANPGEGRWKDEDQKEGLERACQTARSKVLGDDAGC